LPTVADGAMWRSLLITINRVEDDWVEDDWVEDDWVEDQ
jgi:hypothetical protein